MSNTDEDIVPELSSKFIEPLPVENAVTTSDGMEVCITAELWKESLVLREHSVLCIPQKKLDVPKSVLMALIEAHGHGTFPKGVQESYDLLAASVTLKLSQLVWKCFANLCHLNAFDRSVDLPLELSSDTVMRVLRVLMGTPLRTDDIYEEQLSPIVRYCAKNREMTTNLMNVVRQSLEKFASINLEGIPVPFTARTVPVAILERKGKLRTAVIVGSEVKLVDLFGTHVDLETLTGVSDFHLKYGDYLLYRCSDNLYHKNLRDDSQPTKLMDNCCNLLTRGKFVFATRTEKSCSSILLWIDGRFEEIFQSPRAIRKIEFDDVTNVLALIQVCRLLLFRLENENLTLLEEKDLLVSSVLLSGEDIFVIRESTYTVAFLTYQRDQARRDPESGLSTYVESRDSTLFTDAFYPSTWSTIVFCGGSYFLTSHGQLELILKSPEMDETILLTGQKELYALSELWMFP